MSIGLKLGIFAVIIAVLGTLGYLIVQDRLHPAIDRNNDGKPDEWYTFNLKGQIVSVKKDRNGDGIVDQIEEYKDGKISVLKVDGDHDGIFETIMHYDSQGRMETLERDLDKDGRIDRIIHYDPETQRQKWREDLPK